MTWLDEMMDRGLRVSAWYPEMERMARVIRELVAYIQLEDELPMCYETEEAAQQSYDAGCNLSPDAKELLK